MYLKSFHLRGHIDETHPSQIKFTKSAGTADRFPETYSFLKFRKLLQPFKFQRDNRPNLWAQMVQTFGTPSHRFHIKRLKNVLPWIHHMGPRRKDQPHNLRGYSVCHLIQLDCQSLDVSLVDSKRPIPGKKCLKGRVPITVHYS